jgi:hypothetical protein
MDYVRVFVAQAQKRKTQRNAAAVAVVILSDSSPCTLTQQGLTRLDAPFYPIVGLFTLVRRSDILAQKA